jgi:hypothetical protein
MARAKKGPKRRPKKAHQRTPATPRNLERDFENKLDLNRGFAKFKRTVESLARKNPQCRSLLVPLRQLDILQRRGAYGPHLVPVHPPKRRRR